VVNNRLIYSLVARKQAMHIQFGIETGPGSSQS
jgi:hypothetical protein